MEFAYHLWFELLSGTIRIFILVSIALSILWFVGSRLLPKLAGIIILTLRLLLSIMLSPISFLLFIIANRQRSKGSSPSSFMYLLDNTGARLLAFLKKAETKLLAQKAKKRALPKRIFRPLLVVYIIVTLSVANYINLHTHEGIGLKWDAVEQSWISYGEKHFGFQRKALAASESHSEEGTEPIYLVAKPEYAEKGYYIRTQPSIKSKDVTVINGTKQLLYLNETVKETETRYWYKVQVGEYFGWVSSNVVEPIKS